MPSARKILISDPDADVLRELSRVLREKSYQVSVASDGSRALEVAVLRHPDLVLFDEASRLIDVRTFMQILRTNPRTEDIPVVVTGKSTDVERIRTFRDGYLRKPYNLDEVLGRIAQIFRKADAARELKETKEIQGSLKQMGLPDLLQILAVNKRSGRLTLEDGEAHGEIALVDGRPVQARAGNVEGEKALFRLFAWREGSFAFAPGAHTGPTRIRRAMEEALLEGLRQADEATLLQAKLPPPHTRLKLAADAQLPAEQHPVIAELVRLLAQPRTVSELLDLTTATDYQVLSSLVTLLDKKLVDQVTGAAEAEAGPLLSPAELHALRARILRGRVAAKTATGKIALCANDLKTVRRVLDALGALKGFRPLRAPSAELLGTWGSLELPDGLRVDFTSIPAPDEAAPLWRPIAAGALGALVLDLAPSTAKLAAVLARDLRLPLVLLADGSAPPALKDALRTPGRDPVEGVKALLAVASRAAAA